MGRVLAAVDKANGFSFAASEVREIMKEREERAKTEGKVPDIGEQEAEMRKRANNLFKLASNSDAVPSYHHTIAIMERYESGTAADTVGVDAEQSNLSKVNK